MRSDRRDFLNHVATVGAVSLLPATTRASVVGARAQPDEAPAVLELPLAGARVVRIHPLMLGAIPIVLEYRGECFQVDVHRRSEDGLSGVVDLEHVSLFVANDGNGDVLTGKERELATRALAIALADHLSLAPVSEELLTFEERQVRHHGGIYDVLNNVLGTT